MSRLAKKPIDVPAGTEVSISDSEVVVKGRLGTLRRRLPGRLKISFDSGKALVLANGSPEGVKPLLGAYASHLRNMIRGVNEEYEKKLIIEGIGFKAEVKGGEIVLSLGFSHPVKIKIPDGVKVTQEKGVLLVSGIDKERVGEFAAAIRSLREPEPYKGKGIRYSDEVIRRKQGKKTV
ncbi:MAG: 50S ribosomal protein L6 [Candidatus Taylorbacteria bacterium]|nr:50S ribosomal protein L6 [Candidatus Taylorbacteria bacterium]